MKIIVVLASLMLAVSAFGQQLSAFNQNYIVPFVINPAAAGVNSSVDVFLLHRNQWTNLPGAPLTNSIIADSPIKVGKNGVGLKVTADEVGIFRSTSADAAYSHKFTLGSSGIGLRFGGSIGITDLKADFTRAVVVDPNETYLFSTAQRQSNLNGSLGFLGTWRGLEIGLASPRIISNSIRFSDNDNTALFKEAQHLIGSFKYEFILNKARGIAVYPYAVIRSTKNVPLDYELSAVFDYQQRFWIAGTYRSNSSIAVNAGIRLYNTLTVGYSYDVVTNVGSNLVGRSSEVVIGFSLNSFSKKNTDLLADGDNDGVADEFDLEPNTEKGAMVNFQGKTIPLAMAEAGNASIATKNGQDRFDADKDFVPDSIDAEPNTPKGLLVDRRGRRLGNTYDLDLDGVADSIDAELDTRKGALVDAYGKRIVRENEDLDEDGVNDMDDDQLNSLEMSIVDARGNRIGSKYDVDDDGVADSVDVELNTAKGTVVNHYGKGLVINVANTGDTVDVMYETSFFFDFDKSYVKPGHDEQFSSVARYLFANKNARIILTGHSDSRGNAAYNMNLGQKRAQAIAGVLIRDYDVPADKISIVMSKGSGDPLSPSKHHINRRVDVNVEKQNY